MWRLSSSTPSGRLSFGSGRTKGVKQRRNTKALHRDVTKKDVTHVTQRRNTETSRNDVRRSEHDCWSPKRDKNRREPRCVGAGGSRVAGGRRAQRAGGAGSGDRLRVRGRGVSRGGGDASAEARRRVGQ